MQISKRQGITFVIVSLIIFQDVLTDNGFYFMTFFDEIASLLLFVQAIVYNSSNLKLKNNDIYFMILIFGYYVWGWVCQIKYNTQPMDIAMKSSLLSIKFFVMFLGALLLSRSTTKVKKYITAMYEIEMPIVIMLSLFVIITETFKLSVFIWPWDLCAKSVFLILITIINWANRKRDYFCIITCSILLLSTGKAKAFAAIALLALVMIWIIKKRKKIKIYHILIMGTAAVAVAWKKIIYYYVYGFNRYARSVLTMTGFKIAKDKFPFGLGWGSYASYYSGVNYSQAYYEYGLDTHGEVGAGSRAFLMDTYWPSVLGETGWIGCILIILIVLLIFLAIQKIYKVNRRYYAAGIMCLAYLLVTTMEESGFMQPNLMWLSLILAIIISIPLYLKKKNLRKYE